MAAGASKGSAWEVGGPSLICPCHSRRLKLASRIGITFCVLNPAVSGSGQKLAKVSRGKSLSGSPPDPKLALLLSLLLSKDFPST